MEEVPAANGGTRGGAAQAGASAQAAVGSAGLADWAADITYVRLAQEVCVRGAGAERVLASVIGWALGTFGQEYSHYCVHIGRWWLRFTQGDI